MFFLKDALSFNDVGENISGICFKIIHWGWGAGEGVDKT